jgi:hypothetical protein
MLPVVKEPRYQDNEYKFSRASSVINLSDDKPFKTMGKKEK